MSAFAAPVGALIDPLNGVRRAVENRRWVAPLVLLAGAVTVASVALASRWDATPEVLASLTKEGDLEKTTEQELSTAIQTAERTELVAGVAKGVVGMPLAVVALAGALRLLAWLLGRKAGFTELLAAAGVGLLPLVLYQLLVAAAALRATSLSHDDALRLVPTSVGAFVHAGPRLVSWLKGLDFFRLWSVALLGLGFAQATRLPPRRAVATLVACYALAFAVFSVSLPALLGGAT